MPVLLRPPRTEDEAAVRYFHEQLMAVGFPFLLIDGTWDRILETIRLEAEGKELHDGQVPADYLVAEVDGTLVGRVSIRHQLNEYLIEFGGHIGYAVAPEFRGRGYATEILQQSVARLSELGVDRVLVTCEAENLRSARVIEKCGGVLEDIRPNDGTDFRRYWITPGRLGDNIRTEVTP